MNDCPVGYLRAAEFRAGFNALRIKFNWPALSSRDIAPNLGEQGAVIFLHPGWSLSVHDDGKAGSVYDPERRTFFIFSGDDVVIDIKNGYQTWPATSVRHPTKSSVAPGL